MQTRSIADTVRRWTVLGVTALLLVASAGCVSSEASSIGPLVLQPGRPGDPAATLGPDAEVPQSEWNHMDMAFMQMMIPHHAQALEMARLARSRAESGQVNALASRIDGSQGPEILAMSAWLQARKLEVPAAGDDADEFDHDVHGHATMHGMLSESQMEALASARGERFDRLFLNGMIRHHEGAVYMAEEIGTNGVDIAVSELAADVVAGQSAEAVRMRALLREL